MTTPDPSEARSPEQQRLMSPDALLASLEAAAKKRGATITDGGEYIWDVTEAAASAVFMPATGEQDAILTLNGPNPELIDRWVAGKKVPFDVSALESLSFVISTAPADLTQQIQIFGGVSGENHPLGGTQYHALQAELSHNGNRLSHQPTKVGRLLGRISRFRRDDGPAGTII
jgi:hypothetical protein